MNFDDARSRLRDQYTVMRADPFIIDAGLWLTLSDLAQAMRDTYTTRLAWENATGPAVAAELERLHRRVHRDLLVKLDAAASAAEHHGGAEGAPEAPPPVSGRAAATGPSGAYGEGAGRNPQPTREPDPTGGAS